MLAVEYPEASGLASFILIVLVIAFEALILGWVLSPFLLEYLKRKSLKREREMKIMAIRERARRPEKPPATSDAHGESKGDVATTHQEKGTDAMNDDSGVSKAEGLLPVEEVQAALRGYPAELILCLRQVLGTRCPSIREKCNPRGRYFGYASGRSDSLYVYFSKKHVTLDLKLPPDRRSDAERRGFTMVPRDNWQAKAGWLTGVRAPNEIGSLEGVLALAVDALEDK